MVGGEGEAEGLLREAGGVAGDVFLQVRDGLASLRQAVQQVMEFPGVVRVEGLGRVGEVVALGLGEEVDLGIIGIHLGEDALPEFGRDLTGGVAAEAIDTLFQPEAHGVVLGGPDGLVLVVEAPGIGPVVLPDGVAVGVALVEVGRLFGHPHVVRSGLVGHPVQDDLESQFVGLRQQVFEVFHRPEFGIDLLVVGNGVVGAQGALAAFGADLVHGHQPEDVHAQVLQAGKLGFDAPEGSLGRELADIHFIHHGVVGPVRMGGRGRRRLLAGGKGQDGRSEEEKLFHACVLLIG